MNEPQEPDPPAFAASGYLPVMPCYEIPSTTSYGTQSITKWANTPAEAEALAKKCATVGAVIGKAKLVSPQPFSDEARALRQARDIHQLPAAA